MVAKVKARMSGVKPAKPAAGTYLLGCKKNVRLMSFTQIEGEIGSSSNISLAFRNSLSLSGSTKDINSRYLSCQAQSSNDSIYISHWQSYSSASLAQLQIACQMVKVQALVLVD